MSISRAPILPSELNQAGTEVNKPAAAPGNAGIVYYGDDDGSIQRSDGTTWTSYGADPAEGRTASASAWRPRHQGFVGWTYDPILPNSGTAPVAGVIQLSRINVPVNMTFSNVVVDCGVLAVTPANMVFGVYDRTGTVIGKSADVSASFLATTGRKIVPLTGAPFTKVGGTVESGGTDEYVWAAMVIGSAGTVPQFSRMNAYALSTNINLTAATARTGTILTAQTDLVNITPASIALISANTFWFGLT